MLSRLVKLLVLMIPILLLAQCGGIVFNNDQGVTAAIPTKNDTIDRINSSPLSTFIFGNLEWILPVVILLFVLVFFFKSEAEKKKHSQKR